LRQTRLTARFITLFLLISACIYGQETPPAAAPAPADTVAAGSGNGKLKAQVKYNCRDSMIFEVEEDKVHLYDSAVVVYEQMTIKAHYIVIDFGKDLVTAEGIKDSTGKYTTKALFIDGDQEYRYDKITYNMQSQKAKIYSASTIDGDSHVIAEKAVRDSTNTVYIHRGIYTTCELDHPHFAIRAKKLKVIPNDKIVTGPAYLEISDVPTPLGIPFGFFPNKKERSSGLLIPSPGESPELGFYLRDGGWYWGISDKIDLALRGDIYSKGSWGAKAQTNYKVRYKYYGNMHLKYANILQPNSENPAEPIVSKQFFVNWQHTQDPKFNPSIRFSARVEAGSAEYNAYNSSNIDVLNNQFRSNVAWTKTWNFGYLSANLAHSQSTVTHQVDLTLPQISFAVNRFYPFRNPKRIGTRWYDKIGISMTNDFQNLISIPDSLIKLDNPDPLLNRMRNGIRTSIPISSTLQFKKMSWLTMTPAVNFNTYTYFRTISKSYTSGIVQTDSLIIDTIGGARIAYDYNASTTFSTRLYATGKFDKGRIMALRHIVTPQLSFTYRPDFSAQKYGWYRQVPNNMSGGFSTYSIFEGGVVGSPGSGEAGLIGMNIVNSVESKLRPKSSDTSTVPERRILLDQFTVNFSYNLLAEHFNWSHINFRGQTKLFKKLDVNSTLQLDPYRINEEGTRIERFEWRENKRLGRITAAAVNLSTSLRQGGLTAAQPKASDKGTQQELDYINQNPQAFVDFNIPWSLNLGYTINYSKPFLNKNVTQALQVSGDVNITSKWKIGFNSNYDIELGEFSYTSLNVYRDLHCWEMSFNWVPFGRFQNYNLTINVKSPVLQDLKLNRRRNWYDF